ncbi:MAG: hypothetical protein JSV62_15820 [Promethearchaeota archaeon]|nr:MAG: hypothetical protein JSV62_15820 [Candidatus Lokiarchaeota archaeon]
MVLIVAKVVFPHAKSSKVAKKNIEMIKKYPADPSLGTTLVIGVKSTIDVMEVLAVVDVKNGKVEENMSNLAKQYQEYALEIDGFKYQMETYFSIAEAYNILGMEPPPEE